ncbi:MAG TPA: LysR family transcriptional regulator [Rhizomicrobium sp.]|nr:LysR family transcriptional regulator [Rhizomicrobium sp.]
MYNWDDLRIFLSVARHKSLQGAADQLGLDATTVGRRVARLEQALNCTLIARGRQAQLLTANGKRLFEAASRVEMATEDVRTAVGETGSGVVRISTSEGFGTAILAPAVPQLLAKRPKLQLEIVAMPGFLSPAMREVDIAVTLGRPDDARLEIEKLTEYTLGLYASQAYLDRQGTPANAEDLRRHIVVGYIDDLLYANELRYLDDVLPGLKPSISSSSIRAQQEMIARDCGIGVLPCFMAETAPGLMRVLPKDVSIVGTFWLSARRDLLQTARVRQVRRWIGETVAAQRTILLPV